MKYDKKFIMSLWPIVQLRRRMQPKTVRIMDAQSAAFKAALISAMNGDVIIKLPPPTTAYRYYRGKWIETGDTRYLELMKRNFHGEE